MSGELKLAQQELAGKHTHRAELKEPFRSPSKGEPSFVSGAIVVGCASKAGRAAIIYTLKGEARLQNANGRR